MVNVDTAELIKPDVLRREWVSAPTPDEPQEFPGLRKYKFWCGVDPELGGSVASAFNLNDIVKGLIAHLSPELQGEAQDLLQKITQRGVIVDDVMRQITLQADLGVPAEEDTTLLDAITVIDKDVGSAEPREFVEILVDLIQEALPDDAVRIGSDISAFTSDDYVNRLEQLANLLGISRADFQNQSLQGVLATLLRMTERVDELTEFQTAEGVYLSRSPHPPEIAMLDTVALQIGVECIPYAALNLYRAANRQGALVEPVRVAEIQERLERVSGGREFGFLEPYLVERGFKVNTGYTWSEVIGALEAKTGGLIMVVDRGHALTIVGVRRTSGETPRMEFLVANPLPVWEPSNHEDPTKPVWVNANSLIARTTLRNAGETGVNRPTYLVTWPKVQVE